MLKPSCLNGSLFSYHGIVREVGCVRLETFLGDGQLVMSRLHMGGVLRWELWVGRFRKIVSRCQV